MNDLVYVAKIGKTVGLKGELKLHIDSDFPKQFVKDKSFTTNRKEILTIESFNANKSAIKFYGYDTIDNAKKLINLLLYTSKEDSTKECKLDKNQYFWFDIISCEVYENETLLGTVKDVQRFSIDDFLQIQTSKELLEKKLPNTFLVPYISRYVTKVDIENKKIYTNDCLEILENS